MLVYGDKIFEVQSFDCHARGYTSWFGGLVWTCVHVVHVFGLFAVCSVGRFF